jgi:hypothetical protein
MACAKRPKTHQTANRLSLIDGPGELTAGLMANEHDSECPNITNGQWTGEADCECERLTFSWQRCEGCGSTLGGSREALTYWDPKEGD